MIITALCLTSIVVLLIACIIYALRSADNTTGIIYSILGLGLTYLAVMTIALLKLICG